MKAIVAVDINWGIGKDNQLLYHIKEDMKRFKDLTMNKVVVMGRKTFESLPDKKPLPYRVNIVMSKDTTYKADGAIVVHSIEELNDKISIYDADDVFIIGGGKIYEEFITKCSDVYVTVVTRSFNADTFFPNLNVMDEFILVDDEVFHATGYETVETRFLRYANQLLK